MCSIPKLWMSNTKVPSRKMLSAYAPSAQCERSLFISPCPSNHACYPAFSSLLSDRRNNRSSLLVSFALFWVNNSFFQAYSQVKFYLGNFQNISQSLWGLSVSEKQFENMAFLAWLCLWMRSNRRSIHSPNSFNALPRRHLTCHVTQSHFVPVTLPPTPSLLLPLSQANTSGNTRASTQRAVDTGAN